MITCTNCSVQSPEGTKFCPNCGQDLAAQQAAAQPPAPPPAQPPAAPPPAAPPPAAPPPAQPAAPQMPAQVPPPAAPSETVQQPAAAAPPPVEPPAAYSAPPAASGGGGGIGMSGKIAAAVGAVVILGGVFAGVRLLTGNDERPVAAVTNNGGSEEPEPVETTTPEPVETTAAPEEVPESEPTEAPESGAVSDILQDPVGTWALQDVAQSPDIAQAWGATDALSALYANPGGLQVGLTIAAYTSPEDAFSTVPVLAESLLGGRGKNRFQVVDAGEVTDQNEQLIGQYVLLTGPVEIIFWSNGPFIRAVEGGPGSAIDFYANSSF